MRVVVCAAIRNRDTGVIVCGARHFDEIMRQTIRAIIDPEPLIGNGPKAISWKRAEQGFIDQFGIFMTRAEAAIVAQAAGQNKGTPLPRLFSEDLY